MNDILVIGIAGGTGSGKTTLTNQIVSCFHDHVTILKHDNYYILKSLFFSTMSLLFQKNRINFARICQFMI